MGEPVARGRIKVDARKALDKLRDHMLVDPHLWACEIARVAIALGATRIAVAWTTSDFVLEFDGRALPIAQVAHARDHVLTPFDGPDGDALRSLGIGVGAALGLDPAFVEVTCTEGDTAKRVRFERNYIDADAETEAPAPADADPQVGVTTRVLLRRRLGLGSITRAISTDVPPEATLLEANVDRTRISVKMRGSELVKPPAALVSVDLDVPGATRAVLEILDPTTNTEAVVCFYEHGVLLTSFEAKPWGLTQLPVRYIVDAARLPTNASRSQMRSDAELTRRVVDRVLPAFTVAVAALRGETTFGHEVKTSGTDEERANALGAIVAQIALVSAALGTPGVGMPEAARALQSIPVVYDALGRFIPLAELRGGTQEVPLRVYTGDEAMPMELAPWVDGVLWKRGLAAERALVHHVTAPADDLVLPAKKAFERRARAMQHAPSLPVVTPTDATLHRESFKVTFGPFEGLHGEIAIVKAQAGRLTKARVFVDERALEEMALPGVRLPVEIALAWPDHIVARFEYDAVSRNEHLARALHVALRLAALAIAHHLPGRDAELVRLAISTWVDATRTINDGAPLGDLSAAPVWRTNDGRLVSLDAIIVAAAKGAVCFARVETPATDGRTVVARAEVDALRALMPKVQFVPYDEFLGVQAEPPETPNGVAVVVQRGAFEGFITPGNNRIRVYHGSQRIKADAWKARFGPVDVNLRDRDAIPKQGELTAIWASPIPDLEAEELMLLEKTIEAVEHDALGYETVRTYLMLSTDKLDDGPLKERAKALPVLQERKRRDGLRGAVLARAPLDLAAKVGDLLRGTARNKQGAATCVLIAAHALPRAELLFQGHPLGSITRWAYPLDVFIDVVDDELVTEDWMKLSDRGLVWADGTVLDAALDLLRRLVDRDDFADNEAALKLLATLLHESPTRAAMVFQIVRWPTVQGRTMKLVDDVAVRGGLHRYEGWQSFGAASPYDAAAIHVPSTPVGEARKRVLSAAGITVEDVTDQVARLQSMRSKSARTPPPKLGGTPQHPLLRTSLAELGVTLAEGELELFEGDWSQVNRVNDDGVTEPTSLALSFPIRVICRPGGEWFVGVEREIQRATWQHLRNLLPKVDELPVFARKQLRRLILSELASADEAARLFPTTEGIWLSLAEVKATEGEVEYTSAPGPFPPMWERVFCLDDAEAHALSKLRVMKNVTERVKKMQRGVERRSAPARERAELDPVARAKCLFVADIDEEGVKGELGFLHPNHANARSLEILHHLRPLCTIVDPEGWPLLGVLNDDALEPDAGHEGLGNAKKDQVRIQQVVRRAIGPAVNQWLKAPAPTLGVLRLPSPFTMRAIKGPSRTPAAFGVFWLPKEWPERPTIEVEGIGISQSDRVPTIALNIGAHSQIVPVCGKVWVSCGAKELTEALQHTLSWVSLRLIPHVRSADARHVEKYRWDLALLGVLDQPATDPVKELARDRPDPELMFVVARRAPQLIDKAVGDAPKAALPMNVQDAVVIAEVPEDAAVPIAPEPTRESFFAGLVRRVVELVTPAATPLVETPLTSAIAEALKEMSLTGDPIARVRATRSGRPVTYHREMREILVNTTHAVVKKAAAQPNGVVLLLVAALSEINRELVEVTDTEEIAKLFDLLRANAND